MKNSVSRNSASIFCLFIALFLLPLSVCAAETPKFGSMDVQKVLNESDAGKKAKSDLEALIKTKQSSIDERGKSIEKMKSDLEKQASVLSPEARKTKEDELERLLREYQRTVQDSQAEIKKKEAELTETILKEIRELIEKMGEEQGYTLIIERGMVLYSNQSIDITDDVLKRFNAFKKSKK